MLTWQTVDLDAPYPKPVYRATGCRDGYTLARYLPDRDRKFDRGFSENWTLTTGERAPYGQLPDVVSYHRSLDGAMRYADEREQARRVKYGEV